MTATCERCVRINRIFGELLQLLDPQVVDAALAAPNADTPEHGIATFINEHPDVTTGKYVSVRSGILYAAYVQWCQRQQYRPVSDRKFARVLTALGYGAFRGTAGVRYRAGIHIPASF